MITIETILGDEEFLRRIFFSYIRSKEVGQEKGEVKGKAKGKAESQKRTAKRMKELGLATDLITQVTNLPVKEIEKM